MILLRRLIMPAVVLSAAAALSACNTTVVNHSDFVPGYSSSLVTSGISDGELATVVHGAASAQIDAAATEQLIIDNVRPPAWLGNTRLAVAPDAQRRLVFVMNPEQIGAAIRAICSETQSVATTAPASGEAFVVGAFCDEIDTMSETQGRVPLGDDGGRTTTVDLVQQLTLALLPRNNPSARHAMLMRPEDP